MTYDGHTSSFEVTKSYKQIKISVCSVSKTSLSNASNCNNSSDNFKCTVISTSLRLGDRAFAAAGPRLETVFTHVRRLDLSLDIPYTGNRKRI